MNRYIRCIHRIDYFLGSIGIFLVFPKVTLPNLDTGVFQRDKCMLSFLSKHGDTNTKGTLFCDTCQEKVKVTNILKRVIFLSYNWGFNNSTQKIAKLLCERIFLQTEMPYWLDVDGGESPRYPRTDLFCVYTEYPKYPVYRCMRCICRVSKIPWYAVASCGFSRYF